MADSNELRISANEIRLVDSAPISVSTNNSPIIVDTPQFSVEVSPRSYHIVSQDIYTIKRNSDIPGFLEDQINNMIDNGDLANDVSDLDNRFGNFKDGVTLEIGYLHNADAKLAYDLSVLKVSNDTNTAGIQRLDTTKVTADEAIAISNATIGAWQNDGTGGAWFNQQVSTVSNVAYSAAKSASTLTASIESQQERLSKIVGDIDVLQSQVDGKVETWKVYTIPIIPSPGNPLSGPIDETAKPYSDWLVPDTRIEHTGDTILYVEKTVDGNDKLIATYRFISTEDAAGDRTYSMDILTDDLASKAYQEALDAGILADGKINTFYQINPPDIIANPTLGIGDLWLDEDDNNKMYRWQIYGVDQDGNDKLKWVAVDNKKIEASVKRLDEATVNVDGTARAKSSLVIDANGVASGFVGESDGATSSFKIFADNFAVVGQGNVDALYPPFSVDTNTRQVNFNGRVSFNNVDDKGDLVERGDLEGTNGTVIDGSAIRTGTINADRFTGNTVWKDGSLRSSDYNLNAPYTSGFLLDALPAVGNPNIYGAHIRGGLIEGATIETGALNAGTLQVFSKNDIDYRSNTVIAKTSNLGRSTYFCRDSTASFGRIYGQTAVNKGLIANRIPGDSCLINVTITANYTTLTYADYTKIYHPGTPYVAMWAKDNNGNFTYLVGSYWTSGTDQCGGGHLVMGVSGSVSKSVTLNVPANGFVDLYVAASAKDYYSRDWSASAVMTIYN